MGLQVLINNAKADVAIALGKTENDDVRRAFRECNDAFDRCQTPDDVLFVQKVFWETRQSAVLYEARARLSRATVRLDAVRKRH
jgi:hypothetical protein